MAEPHLIYESGDVVYVMAKDGTVHTYTVQDDGSFLVA